jgi:succinyl-diaminopimelate desuccinylase
MPTRTTALDLGTDVISLTAAVCDIESVSLAEGPLADAVEAALRDLPHLAVTRLGNTVVGERCSGAAAPST